ncbi:hypothetical protein JHK82_040001 [Glycine max]|nr:hypothetical protein JHK82_040001 [Glycine max]KAG5122074.1 hypothetical protein JHK84_040414 [Glycine max]
MQQCISFNPLDTIKFIDEIDVIGRLRGTGIGGGNDEREQTLNQLLSEMKKLDKDVSLSVVAMRTPGFSGEDPSLISKNQLLARIVGGLGEKVEEEFIFRETEITTGAAVDLQQITQIARQMVTKFGMSKIGPWALIDPVVQVSQQLKATEATNKGIELVEKYFAFIFRRDRTIGLQLETIYVGNSQSSENVKQIMAIGGEKSLSDPLSFTNVQHFWVRLETMRMSKLILGNTPSSDHVLAKLSTLLDMDDREEGWAVI